MFSYVFLKKVFANFSTHKFVLNLVTFATKKLIALRWAFLNDAATSMANDVAIANDVCFARVRGGIASL